jgi:hypothetical protein
MVWDARYISGEPVTAGCQQQVCQQTARKPWCQRRPKSFSRVAIWGCRKLPPTLSPVLPSTLPSRQGDLPTSPCHTAGGTSRGGDWLSIEGPSFNPDDSPTSDGNPPRPYGLGLAHREGLRLPARRVSYVRAFLRGIAVNGMVPAALTRCWVAGSWPVSTTWRADVIQRARSTSACSGRSAVSGGTTSGSLNTKPVSVKSVPLLEKRRAPSRWSWKNWGSTIVK